jgi:hypothetical protein
VESPLPQATMETVIAATRIADKIFFFIFSSPFSMKNLYKMHDCIPYQM